MNNQQNIGFIGLGVMGEPMCRNLSTKSGLTFTAFDRREEPLTRLAQVGVGRAVSLAEMAASDVVFLSLPDGDAVRDVCLGNTGLITMLKAGAIVVDLGTSPVALARELDHRFRGQDVLFSDAPVARTRAAAEAGTLSIMVGADPAVFEVLEPLLKMMGEEVTHCGGVGSGQLVKIMNNMVLFQTVSALAEALAIGRSAGIDPAVMFSALSKGSADSFALRNHGMKAMLPDTFPQDAFSTAYAMKDLGYALELARDVGLEVSGAQLVQERFKQAIDAGFHDHYFPVVSRVI